MKTSSRSNVDPFLVMDIMQKAAILESEGRSIIHMEVGQPSRGASPEALSKLYKKSLSDNLGYSLALGLPELREKIACLYKERYNLSIDPDRVIVTSGSSAGFILAFTALFDPGDKILVSEPGYPSYKNIIKSLSLLVKLLPTKFENRFQLTPKCLSENAADGVLLASPANPTGVSLTREELKSLILTAKKKKMIIISDEIYHGINFKDRDVSALEFDDNAIIINSFSKYYTLTGWRLGWMVVPKVLSRTIEKLAQNLFICPSHASQLLGLFTLDSSIDFDQKTSEYKVNKDMLIEHLPKIGFTNIVEPDGAFYLYADVTKFELDSTLLVERILEDTGVAITPGRDFDSCRGHKTVRFSFACGSKEVENAIIRLTKWCNTYRTDK